MYIRFIIQALDRESGKRQGFFQAMSDLEYEGVLLPHEQEVYNDIYNWFRKNLKKPTTLSKSSKPHAKNMALSWFKDSAKQHISKMRDLAYILESHDVQTEMIRTEKLGYVVYEDQFQITAEPYNDTAT